MDDSKYHMPTAPIDYSYSGGGSVSTAGGSGSGSGSGSGKCHSAVGSAQCTPVPSNGEEACEGHGYGKASCEEVGCCHYAECSIGDGSGECFSAVGTAQCTPVKFSSHVETCPP